MNIIQKCVFVRGHSPPLKIKGLSAAKDDLDVYTIGNLDPHELP